MLFLNFCLPDVVRFFFFFWAGAQAYREHGKGQVKAKKDAKSKKKKKMKPATKRTVPEVGLTLGGWVRIYCLIVFL